MDGRLREISGGDSSSPERDAAYPNIRVNLKTTQFSTLLIQYRHHPTEDVEKKQILSRARIPGALSFRAGLTVEAALVFPLFLLLCSLFFTFFSGQYWQLRLQKALDEVCEDVSVWSYLVDFAEDYTGTDLLSLADGGQISGALEGREENIAALLSGKADILSEIRLFLLEKGSALIWQPLLKEWVASAAGREALRASPIAGGDRGLSLAGSTLHGRDLDLVLSYTGESPLRFPFRLHYTVVQRSCRRLWVGTKVDKEQSRPEEETEEDDAA